MLFGVEGQPGPRMRHAVGIGDCPTLRGNFGHHMVTNGDFVA